MISIRNLCNPFSSCVIYSLIILIIVNWVSSKKAYSRDEKFGKSGGLNPMIKQKYCNLDNYLLDEQNHQIFECIFKPTNVVSNFFLKF